MQPCGGKEATSPRAARRVRTSSSPACCRHVTQILSPQHNGVSATLPAPARAGQAATQSVCARARMAMAGGSRHGQHPSRREHATVLVGVLCATNGTQHQQRHKHTTHSSEQPIFGSLMRARTRNDAWDHASPIVHARLATHRPHLPSKAQHCTMSGKALCSLPHTAASQHTREGLREQCVTAPHTRAQAARAATAHAAARQRQRFAARRTREIPFLPSHAEHGTCTGAIDEKNMH